MKFRKSFLGVGLLLAFGMASATPSPDGYDVIVDVVVVRPVTLVGTIAGSALFVGLLPFTALASIPAPHDGVRLTADLLIVKPAMYTFTRPAGDFGWNTR